MFVVVFEVHPAPGKKEEYLGLAKHLKPILESIDGFIDNERFESKRREGWALSLSTWRDEKTVVRWRSQGEHHRIHEKGRNGIFSDYHLRVCEVTADSHPPEGLRVIEQRLDATKIGEAKALAITEVSPAPNATFAAHPDSLPSHLAFDLHVTVWSSMTCSRASTIPARCCCSPLGRPLKILSGGRRPGSLRLPNSGTAAPATCATTACSNAERRRSTIPMCSLRVRDSGRVASEFKPNRTL
jgi:heme-degrading monooxygenase HmoA